MLLVALLACHDAADCDFPADPAPVDGVLDAADDCGSWSIAVGDHLVVNVSVTDADATCAATLSPGLVQNSTPIFSDFGDDGPKWTFDFVGDAPAEDASVQVDCTDGTTFSAIVTVR